MAKVIAFIGESRRERVLFEGELDDAQLFLQNNYPRIHVEPGMSYGDDGPPADAVVQDDDGGRQFWNGKMLLDWQAPATASNPSNNSRDTANAELADENARLREQLRQFEQQQPDQSGAPSAPGTLPPAVVPGESDEIASSDDVRAALDAHRQSDSDLADTPAASASGEPTPEGQ